MERFPRIGHSRANRFSILYKSAGDDDDDARRVLAGKTNTYNTLLCTRRFSTEHLVRRVNPDFRGDATRRTDIGPTNLT